MTESTGYYDSPLGQMVMTAEDDVLTGLWFEGQRHARMLREFPAGHREARAFADAARWLDAYFSGRDPGFVPELCLRGTAFQRAVWEILLTIPYGQTRTYGAIAGQLAAERGLPAMSAQAVGGAVGRNPVALIVPCHRVIGTDGSLTGYAAGLERKARLLELEGVIIQGV